MGRPATPGHAKWVVSEASETRRPHHRRLPPHKTAATRAGLSVSSSRQRGSIIATKRPMARGLSTACGRRHLSLAPSVILRAVEYSCGIIRRGSNRTSWRRMCVGGIWIFFGRVYIVRLVRKVVFTSATSVLLLYGVVLLVYYLFFACVWVCVGVDGAWSHGGHRHTDG
uniref:Uncharacterized protein n=1 Tax=Oryza sativa subsp. japonica TaxID=39947 RepID=Q652J6_ORYSJ|nr:hypothetical protein [Oryza sativa Japonica Group]BAD46271.1 hypothetical protein [Oryza sativa Japonica Group]